MLEFINRSECIIDEIGIPFQLLVPLENTVGQLVHLKLLVKYHLTSHEGTVRLILLQMQKLIWILQFLLPLLSYSFVCTKWIIFSHQIFNIFHNAILREFQSSL